MSRDLFSDRLARAEAYADGVRAGYLAAFADVAPRWEGVTCEGIRCVLMNGSQLEHFESRYVASLLDDLTAACRSLSR